MISNPLRVEAAGEIQSKLLQIRQEANEAQLRLLRERCPDVVADAERFLSQTVYAPWEVGVDFLEGTIVTLRDKYEVPSARHRSSPDAVAPLTDLFCDAYVLLYCARYGHRPPGA